MKAEITYNGARSYLVGGVKFIDGVTRVVEESALIERCKNTAGFSVHVVKEIREIVAPAREPVEESVGRRKAKSAKSE